MLAILDGTGRRLFNNTSGGSFKLQLAIDSAWNSQESVVSFNLPLTTTTAGDDVWANEHSTTCVAVQIERRGLRYVLPVSSDLDPAVPLQYLSTLHEIFEQYIGGPATEQSIKDSFDVILCLVQATLTNSHDGSARPVLTSINQLKEFVPLPHSSTIEKVVNQAVSQLSASAQPSATSAPSMTANQAIMAQGSNGSGTANMLISSPIPWRRTNIRYASNEIYFDLVERLDFLLASATSSTSSILHASIDGRISARSKLSGMPDLELSFFDPSVLFDRNNNNGGGGRDVSLHPCVRINRWQKERIVSFVPPDGSFDLLYYSVPVSSPLTLPFAARATSTSGKVGASVSLSLSPKRKLSNVVIEFRVPHGAYTISLAESPSAVRKSQIDVLASRPDTSSSHRDSSGNDDTKEQQRGPSQKVRLTLYDQLEPSLNAHVFTFTYHHPSLDNRSMHQDGRRSTYEEDDLLLDDDKGALGTNGNASSSPVQDSSSNSNSNKAVDSIDLSFDLTDANISDVRVQSVKLVSNATGDQYSLYKGSRSKASVSGSIKCLS